MGNAFDQRTKQKRRLLLQRLDRGWITCPEGLSQNSSTNREGPCRGYLSSKYPHEDEEIKKTYFKGSSRGTLVPRVPCTHWSKYAPWWSNSQHLRKVLRHWTAPRVHGKGCKEAVGLTQRNPSQTELPWLGKPSVWSKGSTQSSEVGRRPKEWWTWSHRHSKVGGRCFRAIVGAQHQ